MIAFLLFWMILAPPLVGQTIKYQPGDNPAWADPGFDDAAWMSLRPQDEIEIPMAARGFLWVRGSFVAPSFPESLSVCATGSVAQVWVNGRLLAERGKFPPHWDASAADRNGSLCTPIPPDWVAPGQAVLVAKRVWFQQAALASLRTQAAGRIELKSQALAEAEHERDLALLRGQTVFNVAPAVIQMLFGIFLVLFWRRTKGTIDHLIFGLMLIFYAMLPVVVALPLLPAVSLRQQFIANLIINILFNQMLVLFAGEVFRLRRWRIAFCVAFLVALLLQFPLALASESSWLVRIANHGRSMVSILEILLTVIGCLRLRRERFSQVMTICVTLLFASSWVPGAVGMPNTVRVIWFQMRYTTMFFWILAVCMSCFLLLRAWSAWKADRARDTEFRAAREVQASLLNVAKAPGFRIVTSYLPASEVGGDFYQFLPADDGSLLVVVGDVSGKGLEAAMLVAVIVGGLGNLASRAPAEVLSHLNQVILGKTRGGFVTCCCALFGANGTVEIANAGHIPPYLEGRELELAPGPPLGIFGDADYESATVSSGAAAITFLSDGVVEATNDKGELLGFERLGALTRKPADEIAAAAERWGQEDDITVVQVAHE